jgi:hypothetical protein
MLGMEYFVAEQSIVRKIWGKSDTILVIFAGAAGEFALNKAVDWLYFTGKLPNDPLGRLFSTVAYARMIVFAPSKEAHMAIDAMSKIHSAVEQNRGAVIPDWAYRDVLFMLIHYSISAYELLERKMTEEEKAEVYTVFYRVGVRMGLKELPANYQDWLPVRQAHLLSDLEKSYYTSDLFQQYQKQLGFFRYQILLEVQKLVCPTQVRLLLQYAAFSVIKPLIPIYKWSRLLKFDVMLKMWLLPPAYKTQIKALDCSN